MTHEILRLNYANISSSALVWGIVATLVQFGSMHSRTGMRLPFGGAQPPKWPPKASEVSCLIRQLGRTVNMSVTFLRLFVSIQFPTPLTNFLGHVQYATDCLLYTTAAGLLTIDI
jgi:hypothetical protein